MSNALTHPRTCTAVAGADSVHAAAKQLFVTQPSVSAALAELSKELDLELRTGVLETAPLRGLPVRRWDAPTSTIGRSQPAVAEFVESVANNGRG